MGWRDTLNMGTFSQNEETQKAFWKELYGDLLLEEQEAKWTEQVKVANLLALTKGIQARDEALAAINQEKMRQAEFGNQARIKIQEIFTARVESLSYQEETFEEIKQEFEAAYHDALREHAITQDGFTRKEIEHLSSKAYEAAYLKVFQRMHGITDEKAFLDAQTKKLNEMNKSWFATWFGLKNSKYFSLSCGTTMAGALIIIASSYGSGAMTYILMALATGVAIPIVYVVTRSNWWLTNKPIPDLLLQWAHPTKMWENFKKNLRERPVSTLFKLAVSVTISLVWAAYTYDTTLQLGHELYGKPRDIGIPTEFIFASLSCIVMGSWAAYEAINARKNKKNFWFPILLALITVALGAWLGLDAEMFKKISTLSVTVFMTVFTAPTIYAIFDLWTDRAIKAFSGPIDENGEDNELHFNSIAKSFKKISAESMVENPAAFKRTYYIMMGFGAILAACATLMLWQTIDPSSWFALSASAALISGTIYTAFHFIDKNEPTAASMMYKSLFVFVAAAMIGSFAAVFAADHIMGNVFQKWMGASSADANILNFVFTIGLGFLGCVAFYAGSAKRTIERLFESKSANDADLQDPTGRHRSPDFSKAIYDKKSPTQQFMHRASDRLNVFGTDPTYGEYKTTVGMNAGSNTLPAIAGAEAGNAIMNTATRGIFGFSAFAASLGGNMGEPDPRPRALPDVERQRDVVKMITNNQSSHQTSRVCR